MFLFIRLMNQFLPILLKVISTLPEISLELLHKVSIINIIEAEMLKFEFSI